eukprot:9508229-Prorocentrum_lima.AAC.1
MARRVTCSTQCAFAQGETPKKREAQRRARSKQLQGCFGTARGHVGARTTLAVTPAGLLALRLPGA